LASGDKVSAPDSGRWLRDYAVADERTPCTCPRTGHVEAAALPETLMTVLGQPLPARRLQTRRVTVLITADSVRLRHHRTMLARLSPPGDHHHRGHAEQRQASVAWVPMVAVNYQEEDFVEE